MSSSSQILLDPLPVNVGLEDRPLRNASAKRIALSHHPAHRRCGNGREGGMTSVNHSEDHEYTERKPKEPKRTRSRSRVLKSAVLFERLPANEQLFCFGIHKAVRPRLTLVLRQGG